MMERCTCMEEGCSFCEALQGEPGISFVEAVAHTIRLQREFVGWSRMTLAKAAGVHHNTVVSAENPETDVYLATLEKLASGLGFTTGELMELAERAQYGLED